MKNKGKKILKVFGFIALAVVVIYFVFKNKGNSNEDKGKSNVVKGAPVLLENDSRTIVERWDDGHMYIVTYSWIGNEWKKVRSDRIG